MDKEQEYAISRLIINLCKLANIKAEIAIEMLIAQGALPENYTIQDFLKTLMEVANEPLRRSNRPLVAHVYLNEKHIHKVVGFRNETADQIRERVREMLNVVVTEDF